MTQLTDNLFAVEVPEGMEAFSVDCMPEVDLYELNCYQLGEYDEPVKEKSIDLPPGTWQFVCTTRYATPEQAREITGEELYPSIALAGLCKAKGLDGRKNYCLLKKMEQ